MSYTLNDIDLTTDFGFIPGRAPQSNLAIEGAFDMPARLHKAFHDWKDDNGVEPYVDADEIFFGGRDIKLHGLIRAASESEAVTRVFALQDFVNGFTDVVDLESDWGTWSVLVNGRIQSTYYHQHAVAKIMIPFRECLVDMSGGATPPDYTPSYSTTVDEILEADGVDDRLFSATDCKLLSIGDFSSRPEPKAMTYTKYGTEGYEVTRHNAHVMGLKLLIKSVDFETFDGHIRSLYAHYKNSGLRHLTANGFSVGEFFVKDGFKVSDMMVLDGGETLAIITIPVVFSRVDEVLLNALFDADDVLFSDADDAIFILK